VRQCEHIRDLAAMRAAGGRIPPGDRRDLERHLSSCEACRRAEEEFVRVLRLVDAAARAAPREAQPELTDEAAARIRAALPSEEAGTRARSRGPSRAGRPALRRRAGWAGPPAPVVALIGLAAAAILAVFLWPAGGREVRQEDGDRREVGQVPRGAPSVGEPVLPRRAPDATATGPRSEEPAPITRQTDEVPPGRRRDAGARRRCASVYPNDGTDPSDARCGGVSPGRPSSSAG
jgi:hypothetical protein